VCFLALFLSLLVHGFKVADSRLVGAREVGSIPKELLRCQGWVIFRMV
jgi:hypothetical protein